MKTQYWTRMLLALALVIGAPTLLCGCPQVMSKVLPVVKDIVVEILDAERKIDLVDDQAKQWFAKYPNAVLEGDWQKAVDKTKASLDIALKTAHGAEELAEGDREAAFHEFGLAWQALMELASQIGMVTRGGTFAAGPMMGVAIEPPLALQPRGAGQ